MGAPGIHRQGPPPKGTLATAGELADALDVHAAATVKDAECHATPGSGLTVEVTEQHIDKVGNPREEAGQYGGLQALLARVSVLTRRRPRTSTGKRFLCMRWARRPSTWRRVR